MNLRSCGVIFIVLTKLVCELWQVKSEKCSNFRAKTWLTFADRRT